MKQFKLMMMAALAALMSFSVVSCSDDDDDSAQSKHDKKMEAVSAEVKANKKNDIALLLVTFGSTWDAPQETFKGMKEQFAKKFSNMDVYFSFTSEICMTRCAAKGWNYYAPSFYLEAIGLAGYKTVCVQSLHVIPGEEYLRVQNSVKDFHYSGDHPEFGDIKVYLAGPLLESEDDVKEVATILHKNYKAKVDAGKIVTFMGHGNPEGWNYGNGNSRYTMLEEELQNVDHLRHLRTGYGTVRLERAIVVAVNYAQRYQSVHNFGVNLNVSRIRERCTSKHGECASKRQYQCKNLFEIPAKISKLWYNSWIWNIFVDLLNYFRLYVFSFKHHYMDAASAFRTAVSKFDFGRLNKNQIINFTNYIIHLAALSIRNIHLLYLFLRHTKHQKSS